MTDWDVCPKCGMELDAYALYEDGYRYALTGVPLLGEFQVIRYCVACGWEEE